MSTLKQHIQLGEKLLKSYTLKQHIQLGEKLLKSYRTIIDEISLVNSKKELLIRNRTYCDCGIGILLDIEKRKLEEKILTIEGKLSESRKRYMEEFELDSAECNQHFDSVLSKAKAYFGREPKGISDKLEELIKRWEFAKNDIEQEEKNDIYFEIKGIIEFFKKQKK